MNHIEEADKFMKLVHQTDSQRFQKECANVAQAHALIAIAEYNQGQMLATSELVNAVTTATNSLDKIAEQLERMNNTMTDTGIAKGFWDETLEDK